MGDAARAYNKLLDIEYQIILGRKGKNLSLSISFEEYPPLPLSKRKSSAPIAELSTFHFPSAERVSLHLAFGKRRTVVRLCKAQPFQILHFALERLTDTQVACRLDWQGLINYEFIG